MNPHELIQHAYQSAAPRDGFTQEVLQTAQNARKPNGSRAPRTVLLAAVLTLALVMTAAATGVLQQWLNPAVELKNEAALESARSGELLFDREIDGLRVKFGQFLCVGRFLYTEVELEKADGSAITEEELYNATFFSTAQGLLLDYDTPYLIGDRYPAWGEGFSGHAYRLDNGDVPGYAHYTLAWTLSRHDYEGQTLHVQLWEPWVLEPNGDGTYSTANNEDRQLLAEVLIQRERPADEQIRYLDTGDEVRLCGFGAEVQGRAFLSAYDRACGQDCGVILADGTRVPFSGNYGPGDYPELEDAHIWNAFPFTQTVDAGAITGFYLGQTILPLLDEVP